MTLSTTRKRFSGLIVLCIIFLVYVMIYLLSRYIGDGMFQDVAMTVTWFIGLSPFLYLIVKNIRE